MKKILLSVTCANSEVNNEIDSFYIELSEKQKKRIIQLADNVSKLGVFVIAELDYSGEWSKWSVDSADFIPDGVIYNKLAVEIVKLGVDVGVPMLRVKADSFQFTAQIKHGTDDMLLSTRQVSIDSIKDNESYINLD